MKTVSLGDVVEVLNGYAFKSSAFTDVGPNVVRISNIQNGKVDLSKTAKVSLDTVEGKTRFELNENDLLVAMSGATTGKIGVLPPELSERAFLNQRVGKFRIRDDEKIDSNYLRYVISSKPYQDDIWSVASGVAQPNISTSQLMSFKIPLPPLPEQKRIAAILDQADALRRQRQRALDHLNQLGQSIFYEMFGEWSDTSENWEIVNLGDKLDFLTSGSRGWAKYYSDKGAKFIRIQNVKDGIFDSSDLAHVEAPDSAEAKRTLVEPGDVLMSITADLGRAAIIPDNLGPAHINQHLAILRSKEFNPYFLVHAITSPFSQRNIERKNNGGVKSGLNFTDIRTLKIIFPPKNLQDKFAKRLKANESFQHQFIKSMDSTHSLFASLQQRAFRGEL